LLYKKLKIKVSDDNIKISYKLILIIKKSIKILKASLIKKNIIEKNYKSHRKKTNIRSQKIRN